MLVQCAVLNLPGSFLPDCRGAELPGSVRRELTGGHLLALPVTSFCVRACVRLI